MVSMLRISVLCRYTSSLTQPPATTNSVPRARVCTTPQVWYDLQGLRRKERTDRIDWLPVAYMRMRLSFVSDHTLTIKSSSMLQCSKSL